METRPPSLAGLAAVVAFALSCFGLLIYLWSAFGGPVPLSPASYRFTATYDDASQLVPQTDVRISGVSVGRVTEVSQDGHLTRAELELDAEQAPIPTDTRTILRRKTLLGEPFVELIPGTSEEDGGETLPEDGELAYSQTEPAVDLDEVLRALDEKTRRDIKIVLHELARGVGEQGEALNASLANLAPTTVAGADLFEILGANRDSVRTLVRDSGTVLDALSERRGQLSSLVDGGARVLTTTASRDRELTATVRQLPPLLAELRPTLTAARDLGIEFDPLLTELEPAAGELTPTVAELRRLAPDLRKVFVGLGPLLDAVPKGVPAFTRTLATARPLMREVEPALDDAVPTVEWLIPYDRELSAWFTKLGTATQSTAGRDGRHILRTMIPFTQEGLAIYGDNPLPINRHNPYSKPGYLLDVGTPHLKAFDCDNASLQELPLSPPCEEQGPFSFNGFTGTYPQVHAEDD